MAPAEVLLILRIIIAIALYAFLSLVLITLWRDLKTRSDLSGSVPSAHLLTLSGESLQASYALEEVNLLGRANDNTLTLNDATISAYHARISCRQGTWWLEDLGSKNGTLINNIPITEPTVVTFGDEIHLGSVSLHFSAGPASLLSDARIETEAELDQE